MSHKNVTSEGNRCVTQKCDMRGTSETSGQATVPQGDDCCMNQLLYVLNYMLLAARMGCAAAAAAAGGGGGGGGLWFSDIIVGWAMPPW